MAAKSTIPDFQTTVEIDMKGCVDLRDALRELSEDEPAPSYDDMVIRACALALREHPRVNSSYRGDAIELHGAVNVGMAVAADQRLLVAAILAVGAVAPRAVVRDGELVARTTMRATLSADHRIVYGADAAVFLASIRRLLEQPVALLIG